ncbi:type II secretion system F family protein [Kitasatospora sp. NPDC058965]|uniref:type II secretion system F family protein n=1 Tax=Kitasatospora sp. NPDC058965 TaxID=3346682 RepID=UPI00369946A2
MIATMAVGGAFGLGLFLLVRALLPSRVSPAQAVARIDALRAGGAPAPAAAITAAGAQERFVGRIGPKVAAFYAKQGWTLHSQRTNLALLDKPVDVFLAQKVLFAAAGLLVGPLISLVLWETGFANSALTPVWLTLVAIVGCFFLPDAELATEATKVRAQYQRAVSVYMTLVHLNLAGGAGLPEAMKAAAESSNSAPMVRIRHALVEARLQGIPQWQAPGRLGEAIGLPDLVDLTSTLSLVAEDGAKIRQSLKARAETLRRRDIARMESTAGNNGQSMLVAQMPLVAGFLVFLGYPAMQLLTAF